MNAVDIVARGIAAKAMLAASPIIALDAARVRVLDPTGEAGAILTSDRGLYVRSADAPSAQEDQFGFAFTDAGGVHWAKPAEGDCLAREYGIVASDAFDDMGLPTGPLEDQAPRIQAVIDRIASHGGGTLRFAGLKGAIVLKRSIIVPIGVSIDGGVPGYPWRPDPTAIINFVSVPDGVYFDSAGQRCEPATEGNAARGILFWCNIDPANPNTWIVSYPNSNSGSFSNLSINGEATAGIKGFRFGGSHQFRNIMCETVTTLIEKPNLYCDSVVIENIFAEYRPNRTDYLIDLPGLGDAIKVDSVAAGYSWDYDLEARGPAPLGISVGLCRGGTFSNLVNGFHRFYAGAGMVIDTPHIEGGQFEIDGADVTIRGGHLENGGNAVVPIVLKNSWGAYRNSCRVTIEDTTFSHFANSSGAQPDGWASTDKLDIDIQSARVQLVLNAGNRRKVTVVGAVDRKLTHAPLIGDSTNGGVFPAWRRFAPMLATQPTTIVSRRVIVSGTMPSHADTWFGLTAQPFSAPPGAPPVRYKGPTGTNRYFARPLYDDVRKIGRDAAVNTTVTIAVTKDGAVLPGFVPNIGSPASSGALLWEVLRDTGNDGSYDKRALVPGIDLDWLIDDGNAINSFAWENYGPSPTPPELNNAGHCGRMSYREGILTILDSNAAIKPTVGTWSQGDELRWPGTVPDGNSMKLVSAVCRTAGTPGVFDFQRISTVSPAV